MAHVTAVCEEKYEQAIRGLIEGYKQDGPEDMVVYLCRDPEQRVVRMVIVSEEFPHEINDTAWAMGFRADDDIPCQTASILLHPDDYARVRAGELKLPQDWRADDLEQVYP